MISNICTEISSCPNDFSKDQEKLSIIVALAVFLLVAHVLPIIWSPNISSFELEFLLDFLIYSLMSFGVGIFLLKFLDRRLIVYSVSIMVFLLTMVFTIGVLNRDPKTISSVVIEKWEESIPDEDVDEITAYRIRAKCEESKNGYLGATIEFSLYNSLSVNKQIKLTYHTESILGIWGHWLVVDSINSHRVKASGSIGLFGGGILNIFWAWLTFIMGISQVSYLIYKDIFNN